MPNRNREEEKKSISALERWLQEHGCDVKVKSEPNDPPDFWIEIDGETFAAEVTQIKRENVPKAYDWYCKLLKDLKGKASSLPGYYSLDVAGEPEIPKPGSQERKQIIANALQYIDYTKNMNSYDSEPLWGSGGPGILITKRSSSPSGIFLNHYRAERKTRTQEEMQNLLQERVDNKKAKMEKVDCSKKILLLYNSDGFCTYNIAREVFHKINGYDCFHSIFWIGQSGECRRLAY